MQRAGCVDRWVPGVHRILAGSSARVPARRDAGTGAGRRPVTIWAASPDTIGDPGAALLVHKAASVLSAWRTSAHPGLAERGIRKVRQADSRLVEGAITTGSNPSLGALALQFEDRINSKIN